jgi:energy-coupling factor transporter transmembrane protein EcfT
MGGTICDMSLFCSMIVIISAYTFLHSLESRMKAALFLLAGLCSITLTKIRGGEIALVIVLAVLGLGWAKRSKRAAQLLLSGLVAIILLAGMVLATIGGGTAWNTFNRGQDTSGILTASGRTIYWADLMLYCVDHPQGLGYITGIRQAKFGKFAHQMHADLFGVGGADNSYMEVLADAGWLALALYLVMLAKVVGLGWRFAKGKGSSGNLAPDILTRHALRCALLLFLFCLIEGMESSQFTLPLRQAFYIQNILIAIILGASTSLFIASRSRYDMIK